MTDGRTAEQKAQALADELTEQALREGKLIEAGWLALRVQWLHRDAPQREVDDTRAAFFAGAQHLWRSLCGVLDPGAEPTEADLRRMQSVDDELERFIGQFKARHGIET